jgi:hypothetical protein
MTITAAVAIGLAATADSANPREVISHFLMAIL